MRGIVLYGPPASGKSTVTAALCQLDPRFALVRKLKAGNRRGTEYDFVTAEELARLRAAGRLMLETRRYGNTYAIDRHHITELITAGHVPIVHLGNTADIRRLAETGPWLTVLLWIPRQMCEERSRQRGDRDTPQRLKAWDETLADLQEHVDPPFLHRFRTDLVTPAEIGERIADSYDELTTIPSSQRA
ncbi:AAA family ATPase [Nonomuraea rubra]|uniref:Guanylate kinase n=1 Tax=Nonomuraea rubra TaxID=46180 RepID=A0A7X0NLV4_9ACTN|nr:guanylate kinase [Nonomuraea rubra]MBB6545862.1 guanylate kinase [Nonomuraea rubra]